MENLQRDENDNGIFKALESLIPVTREAQNICGKNPKFYSKRSYLNEFCTISVAAARRAGHSYSMLRLMTEKGLNVGCIFRDQRSRRTFERKCVDTQILSEEQHKEVGDATMYGPRKPLFHIFKESKLQFTLLSDFNIEDIRGNFFPDIDAIITDDSFRLSSSQVEKIKEFADEFAHPHYRTFRNTKKEL
jgi:hypothetical protein